MDSKKVFIIAVALAAMLTGAWLSWRVLTPEPGVKAATVLPAALDLAEFSLLDQHGREFSRDSFKGHWNLVFFGFTHCPDICPLTMQVLANAQQEMRDAGLDNVPRIVLISVDPDRDTPELMGRYVAHFGSESIGVTGTLDELQKLTRKLGIYFEKTAGDNDDYSVDHTSVVVVVDPNGQFRALFGAPQDALTIAHDMPLIIAAH